MKWRKKRGEGILAMRVPNTEAFTTPLLFEPGTGFAYGGGIDVAGLMIARAENSTLEHYMRRNIFDVLGMDNTSFNLKHRSIGDHLMPMTTRPMPDEVLVAGYASDPPLKQPLEPRDEFGGGGLFSNTEEYLELLKSLLRNDGKLLKPENIDLVFKPCISPPAQESLKQNALDSSRRGYYDPKRTCCGHSWCGRMVFRVRRHHITKQRQPECSQGWYVAMGWCPEHEVVD